MFEKVWLPINHYFVFQLCNIKSLIFLHENKIYPFLIVFVDNFQRFLYTTVLCILSVPVRFHYQHYSQNDFLL